MRKLVLTLIFIFASFCLFAESGIASWYTSDRSGALTANGEFFDPSQLTAAHKSLTFGTVVKVTNVENGLSIQVRINDRGPFVENRIIDLTPEGARQLGYYDQGIAEVSLEIVSEPDEPQTEYVFSAKYSLVEPSVVVITTEQVVMSGGFFGQYVESGAGSGVVMTQDGYIITNNHVVEGASTIKVTMYDGTEYTATLVGADAQTDIAVIKVEAEGLVPAVLGDSDTLAVGQEVLAVGNPLGTLGGTVTNGIISALNRSINVEGQTMTLIQHSAQVSPGNSGGGLFNMNGELVGIVNAKSGDSEAEGIGFAIPVNTAKEVAQELISNGYVSGRPALGVSVISGDTAMQYFGTSGVYVVEVVEGGAAASAGLQYGDRIVSMDGTLVETTTELTDALSAYSAGDTVELQVARKGQLFTVQVTLGEKSAG